MRLYKNRMYSPEADVVHILGQVTIGAAGAVASSSGGNIASVTKLATDGEYEVELSEKFQRLLHSSLQIIADAESAVFKMEIKEDPATMQDDFKADSKFVVQCYDAAGAAVNPNEDAQISMHIMVRRTSVGPFDQ